MENATKALIIAAAVLVAIIIISLTLGVVRQGQETISSADMSQAEMDAYNAKFTMYEGKNVSTADVNALFNTIIVHNQNLMQKRWPQSPVSIYLNKTFINLPDSDTIPRVTGSSRYTVKCVFNKGLVVVVEVTTNS